ncbi:E-selectin-like [Thrips palmi]|uniref:E-selectin-like n=1 Tax=Thrips palmi TaxID=161013 RepID=A0A6P9A9P1_THRPL|nr:E-selectin-like [Thrips palmi]
MSTASWRATSWTWTSSWTWLLLLASTAAVAAIRESSSAASCSRLVIPHGRVKGGVIPDGRKVRVRCSPGYRLVGDKEMVCVKGQWSAARPSCVKPGCNTVPVRAIKKGMGLVLHNGGIARFYCDHGYRLVGSPVLACEGRFWNATIPKCKTSWDGPGEPPKSCAMDMTRGGLCGWTAVDYRPATEPGPVPHLLQLDNADGADGSLYSAEFAAAWSPHACFSASVRSRVVNAPQHPRCKVSNNHTNVHYTFQLKFLPNIYP